MSVEVNGIFGLFVLIADIWAIVNVVQSGVNTGMKIFWILIIVVLPLAGFILWFLLGPKSA